MDQARGGKVKIAKDDFPVLERLGPVPFWRGETRCIPELKVMYRKARDAALRRLAEETAKQEKKGGVL